MTADAVQPHAGGTPSASTVACLFADRFVVTPNRWLRLLGESLGNRRRGKTKVFGTGQVVLTSELAPALIAIGLWQLREQGVVTLETYRDKWLKFIPRSGVRVRLVGGVDDGGGVEKRLTEYLEGCEKTRTGGEKERPAKYIASGICPRGEAAYSEIIGEAIGEAVSLGYLDWERGKETPNWSLGPGLAGVLSKAGLPTGQHKRLGQLCPHTERISALDGNAEKLALAWRDFQQSEPDLAQLLRSTTFKGVSTSAGASTRGGDNDGESLLGMLDFDSSGSAGGDW